MNWASQVNVRQTIEDRRASLTIEAVGVGRPDLVAFAREHRARIDELVLRHGAVLFRGFCVSTPEEFGGFVEAVSDKRLDYLYRSTPRTTVGDRIFTATIYPASLEIPMHNENSYQRDWPMRLAFYCSVPAANGGSTPIADMHDVGRRIGQALLDKFEDRRVKYVRNYMPNVDIPWQTVFQSGDRREVERYCRDHDISCEWTGEDSLRTSQVCQGTARHPVTGERIFFNQAHLFHVSSLGAQAAATMMKVFAPDKLPRNAFFGDGTPLEPEDLETVRDALRQEAIEFNWQAGDVLLVDNMQVAHGRRPFSGKREVLVAMSDPYSAAISGAGRSV
jgi:alpha-ketoglutarate-dependent taurine dioxygenase